MNIKTNKTHVGRWIADAESELVREVTRSATVTRVGLLSAAASHLYGPRDAKPRRTLEEMSALKAAVKARRQAQITNLQKKPIAVGSGA